jgi:hypothetical protein
MTEDREQKTDDRKQMTELSGLKFWVIYLNISTLSSMPELASSNKEKPVVYKLFDKIIWCLNF